MAGGAREAPGAAAKDALKEGGSGGPHRCCRGPLCTPSRRCSCRSFDTAGGLQTRSRRAQRGALEPGRSPRGARGEGIVGTVLGDVAVLCEEVALLCAHSRGDGVQIRWQAAAVVIPLARQDPTALSRHLRMGVPGAGAGCIGRRELCGKELSSHLRACCSDRLTPPPIWQAAADSDSPIRRRPCVSGLWKGFPAAPQDPFSPL